MSSRVIDRGCSDCDKGKVEPVKQRHAAPVPTPPRAAVTEIGIAQHTSFGGAWVCVRTTEQWYSYYYYTNEPRVLLVYRSTRKVLI